MPSSAPTVYRLVPVTDDVAARYLWDTNIEVTLEEACLSVGHVRGALPSETVRAEQLASLLVMRRALIARPRLIIEALIARPNAPRILRDNLVSLAVRVASDLGFATLETRVDLSIYPRGSRMIRGASTLIDVPKVLAWPDEPSRACKRPA